MSDRGLKPMIFLLAYSPSIALALYNIAVYPNILLPDFPQPLDAFYIQSISTGHLTNPVSGFWPLSWYYFAFFTKLVHLPLLFSGVLLMSIVVLLLPFLMFVIVRGLYGTSYGYISMPLFAALPSTYYILNFNDFSYAKVLFLLTILALTLHFRLPKSPRTTLLIIICTLGIVFSHPLVSIILAGGMIVTSMVAKQFTKVTLVAILLILMWDFLAQSIAVLVSNPFQVLILNLRAQLFNVTQSSASIDTTPALNYYHYALYVGIAAVSVYGLVRSRHQPLSKFMLGLLLGTILGGLSLLLVAGQTGVGGWIDRTIFFGSEILMLSFFVGAQLHPRNLRMSFAIILVISLVSLGSTIQLVNQSNLFNTNIDNIGNSFVASHSRTTYIDTYLYENLAYYFASYHQTILPFPAFVPSDRIQIYLLYADHPNSVQVNLTSLNSSMSTSQVYDNSIVTSYYVAE